MSPQQALLILWYADTHGITSVPKEITEWAYRVAGSYAKDAIRECAERAEGPSEH